MAMTLRKAVMADLPVLLEIEGKSTPNLLYLNGVREEFFDNTTGELIVAELDGVPVGFSRFSVQYDGSAWLETLRVDPEHQKKGIGALIWTRFMELCTELNTPFVRMYTGHTNYPSRILGERNGLHVALTTVEGTLKLGDAPDVSAPDFKAVTCPRRAEELLSPYFDEYQGYFCTNRTFYGLGEPLYKGLTEKGMVYEYDGSALVLGARFLEKEGLHLGMFGGDLDACVRFAVAQLKKQGLPKLVCMIPDGDERRLAALKKYGLIFPESKIIMLERAF